MTITALWIRPKAVIAGKTGGIAEDLSPRAISSCRRQTPTWPAIRDELQRASFPGLGKRKSTAGRARNRQSLEAGESEVLIEHADRIAANYILWSRDGVGGNRNAAGQRFELDDAKCVGSARKDEYVRRRDMGRQGFPLQLAEKVSIRKAPL